MPSNEHMLLGNRLEEHVAYQSWSAGHLVPDDPTHYVTISFGRPSCSIESFNRRLAADFDRIVRLVVNIVDKTVYGAGVKRTKHEHRFPLLIRGETRNRFGSAAYLHLHGILSVQPRRAGNFRPERLLPPWCSASEMAAWLGEQPDDPTLIELMKILDALPADKLQEMLELPPGHAAIFPTEIREALLQRNVLRELDQQLRKFGVKPDIKLQRIDHDPARIADYQTKRIFDDVELLYTRHLLKPQ